MVPFAGWAMPVQYKGIVDEHNAVRERAGVFDVSHMGRLFVVGQRRWAPDPPRCDVRRHDGSRRGSGHYTLLCNDEGGIIDDPYVYRLDDAAVPVRRETRRTPTAIRSAYDRSSSRAWMSSCSTGRSRRSCWPCRGRRRRRTWRASSARSSRRSRSARARSFRISRYKLFVSRTGYTGEDGFEIVTSLEAGRAIWRQLHGGRRGAVRAGRARHAAARGGAAAVGARHRRDDESVRGGARVGGDAR